MTKNPIAVKMAKDTRANRWFLNVSMPRSNVKPMPINNGLMSTNAFKNAPVPGLTSVRKLDDLKALSIRINRPVRLKIVTPKRPGFKMANQFTLFISAMALIKTDLLPVSVSILMYQSSLDTTFPAIVRRWNPSQKVSSTTDPTISFKVPHPCLWKKCG